ncbi:MULTISPECIES: TetR/AcrR family transcriptional regulator [unclassified Mesorhizobium]|uniref:TetR/AcrR family transcriptional regulator n=1 Tax=unclassified Mesorhizobium TaxID=325217 RepID=UPI0015E28BC7|nr:MULTISPECIES: TetR/AcrR family transcriptional regulator [unclassified Mesorhizobium]
MEKEENGPDSTEAEVVVRSKSSKRKKRSDTVEHTARQPTQSRSQQRFERILSAAEDLLKQYNIEDISFYDIARKAQISPASINYLFPTMAALHIELARRYAIVGTEMTVHGHKAQLMSRNPSWQSWLYEMGSYTRDEYNRNRYISEVLLGPEIHREARRFIIEETGRAAHELLESFRTFFVLPEIPGLEQKLSLAMHLAESVWERSYILNGSIDTESFEESMRMQIAYLRTVLPETLNVRSDLQHHFPPDSPTEQAP